jgi:hypothetical protein
VRLALPPREIGFGRFKREAKGPLERFERERHIPPRRGLKNRRKRRSASASNWSRLRLEES